MRKLNRLTMTLALLIMAVGGAWAQTPELLVTIESKDYTSFKSGSMTFDDKVTVTFSEEVSNDGAPDGWYAVSPASQLTVAGINGYTITSCKFYTKNGDANTGYTVEGESPSVLLFAYAVYTNDSEQVKIGSPGVKKIEVYGAAEPTEWSLTPDETGKKWTLDKMPASNIELQVEYFAESNLFLSKDALADKAKIAVKAGDLGVQFGDDGKSANTVTEGTPMTVKFNGTKKVLGMKVEKKVAEPVADIVWDATNVTDLNVESTYASYTKEGVKLSGNADQVQVKWNNSEYLGKSGMEFITMESGGFTFTAPTGKAFTKIEMKAQGHTGWNNVNLGTGWAFNADMDKQIFTVTWTGSAASTVKLLKDADMFSGDFISSIAFYLSE